MAGVVKPAPRQEYPSVPVPHQQTTDQPLGIQADKVAAYFAKNPNARLESNRHIAAECRVDEWTVRKWKNKNGVPALLNNGSAPDAKPAKKRKPKKKK